MAQVTADTITVSRTKVYPRPARPGPAWKWIYTVAIPGESHTFSGDSLSWVLWLCKRKAPDLRIVLDWDRAASRTAAPMHCDDCAPEFGCFATGERCSKRPLNARASGKET
jgi:hypothetical protein